MISHSNRFPLFRGPISKRDFGFGTSNSPIPSIDSWITILMSPFAGPNVLNFKSILIFFVRLSSSFNK